MFRPPSLPVCAALIVFGSVPGQPFLAEARPSLGQCMELYALWVRYESHSTLHSSQKARANIALERDCAQGRYAAGVEELRKMLRRGLIPLLD